MNTPTKLTPMKVTDRATHNVIAHFTNGFAETVYQLDNGTVLYINLYDSSVRVETGTLLNNAEDVQGAIHQLASEELN